MANGYREWKVQLVNKRTQMPINDDTGKYIVMTVDVPTLAPIYTDDVGTAATIAATGAAQTITDGVLRWFMTSDVEEVDITILTGAGQAIFVKDLTPDMHRIEVDTEKREQLLIFPTYNYLPTPFISASVTATGSIWSPGFALPANSITKDCWARTSTFGTTSTINIGVSGTPSGLLQGVTAAVTGYHYPFTPDVTAGTATFARGTLLMASLTNLVRIGYVAAAATTLVFGDTTATVLAAGKGWVYISYDILPV